MIYVGTIIAPHGIKGHAKIKSFTDPVTNIIAMQLYDAHHNHFRLKKLGQKGDILICQINDITDRNVIEQMQGTKFFVRRELLPKITAVDEYYIHDIVGRLVKNNALEGMGEVVAVYNFGAGDILEIKFIDGTTDMFPFTKTAFPHIDKESIVFIKPDVI